VHLSITSNKNKQNIKASKYGSFFVLYDIYSKKIMTKLKITKEQYQRILIHEQKERMLVEDKDVSFNHDKLTLMGFAKILGLNLTKQNKIDADKATNSIQVMSNIKTIISDPKKREELIQDLENKGMVEPHKKIVTNYQKIVSNFNQYAKALGMEDELTESGLLNNILRK
jgi:hypothetical protein